MAEEQSRRRAGRAGTDGAASRRSRGGAGTRTREVADTRTKEAADTRTKEAVGTRSRHSRSAKAEETQKARRVRRERRTYVKGPLQITGQALKYTAMYFAFLFYWEFILNIAIYGNPIGRSVWTVLFLIPSAFVLSALTGWFKTALPNRVVTLILTFAVSAFYVVELIYYNSFGSLFSFSMVGQGADAVANFWLCIIATVKESIILLILLQVPFLLVLIFGNKNFVEKFFKFRGYRAGYHVVTLLAAFLCWGLVVLMLPLGGKDETSVYGAYHSSTTDTDTGSEKLGALTNLLVEMKYSVLGTNRANVSEDGEEEEEEGGVGALVAEAESAVQESEMESESAAEEETTPAVEEVSYNQFDVLDFSALAEQATKDDIRSVCEYLASQKPTAKNEYTGMFEGYNLVYICTESFSYYALNEDICPTLTKMSKEGFVFKNYYNGFKNTTTNGEYAFLTGLWPDVSRKAKGGTNAAGSMPQSKDNCMIPAFGHMFNAAGRNTLGFHNYKAGFYDRQHTWPNMGITGRFWNTMKMSQRWPCSDLEMIEQTTDDYINEEGFTAYYMSFSGHGIYNDDNDIVKKNHSTIKKIVKEAGLKLKDSQICYLAANYELEMAMRTLIDRLDKAGQLEKTVFVMASDHYPYYVKKQTRDLFAGHEVDTNFEMYNSPLIIWCPGMEQTIEVDTPCCNVDILPTVMNLFNIPYDSRLYAGTDIFGDGIHVAQLYNRNYITEYVKYNKSTGKATWIDKEDPDSPYAAAMANWTDDDKQNYLDRMLSVVKQRYNFSLAVENTDFYKYLWDNVAGLPYGKEIAVGETEAVEGVEGDFDSGDDDAD